MLTGWDWVDMPPKLFLNVNASVQSFRPGGGAAGPEDDAGRTLQAPSIEIGPSGTLKLFKSFQAFEFNPLGMTRNMTAPLASGAAAMQTSYKVE
jgi:hypothetical protein